MTLMRNISIVWTSRALIKAGNTVEIDYIVFGSTPGQLKGYHSYMESSSLADAQTS